MGTMCEDWYLRKAGIFLTRAETPPNAIFCHYQLYGQGVYAKSK